ncbi:MAG: hypothetical protein GY847_28925 [Proteobacteria bacterium]|nr:hypothetical protein [Pseudomonadota bacterium]
MKLTLDEKATCILALKDRIRAYDKSKEDAAYHGCQLDYESEKEILNRLIEKLKSY